MYPYRTLNKKTTKNVLIQGSVPSLMMETYVQPKHVAVFTCMIKAVYRL